MGVQKFAVLLCAEDSDYVKKKYDGYFGVFVRLLSDDGEKWDVYRVSRGQFPAENEIGEYDGFVITGSCNDAHGNDRWICELLDLIRKLDSMKKKLLGICFGCQILARALGGKTGRAKAGWDIGLTSVHLSSSLNYLTSLELPSTLYTIECHRDEVLELPEEVEVIGWSNKTKIEMFRYGDHMMGVQGHPEYTKDILLNLIDRLLQRSLIQEDFADEVMNGLKDIEPDRESWRKLCTSFLKGAL